jgi:hypothetical protein
MRPAIIALCLLTGLSSCSEVGAPAASPASDTISAPENRASANAYFPLQVGNEWRYRVSDRDDLWVIKRVVDSSLAGSLMVYHVTETYWNGDVRNFLFSVDRRGVVRGHENRSDSVGSIHFRTDLERGTEWATHSYIKERFDQETVPAGTFGPCVAVERWSSEPEIEVYAENIGEIRRSPVGGRSLRLTSARIDGVSYP